MSIDILIHLENMLVLPKWLYKSIARQSTSVIKVGVVEVFKRSAGLGSFESGHVVTETKVIRLC